MSSSSAIEIGLPRIGRNWTNWRRASLATFSVYINNTDACSVEQVGQSSDRDSDVEEVSDASSGTPRKRRKARQRDENGLPEWTRRADIDLRQVIPFMSHINGLPARRTSQLREFASGCPQCFQVDRRHYSNIHRR